VSRLERNVNDSSLSDILYGEIGIVLTPQSDDTATPFGGGSGARSNINRNKAEAAPAQRAETSCSQTRYRFGTVTTEVHIDDPEAARWLAEFLSPWLSTDAPEGTALKVRLTSAGERFSALARVEAERQLQPLPCFRLDRKVVSCPGWIEPDGMIVAADK